MVEPYLREGGGRSASGAPLRGRHHSGAGGVPRPHPHGPWHGGRGPAVDPSRRPRRGVAFCPSDSLQGYAHPPAAFAWRWLSLSLGGDTSPPQRMGMVVPWGWYGVGDGTRLGRVRATLRPPWRVVQGCRSRRPLALDWNNPPDRRPLPPQCLAMATTTNTPRFTKQNKLKPHRPPK